LPNCSGNSRVVVRVGYSQEPTVSSQPTTLTWSGILRPLSRSPLRTSCAVWSLPAKMAVTGRNFSLNQCQFFLELKIPHVNIQNSWAGREPKSRCK
jgi:hypothetical protein